MFCTETPFEVQEWGVYLPPPIFPSVFQSHDKM